MFSIEPVDPGRVASCQALVPWEIREILTDLGALPHVYAAMATLMGRPIGVAVAVRGWAREGEFPGAALAETEARLLALRVAPAYRRIGVGAGLLAHVERELTARGVSSLRHDFALTMVGGAAATDALIARAGWSARRLTTLHCRADHATLDAPVLQEQATLPAEYELLDWVDLTKEDRESIRTRHAESRWYPDLLDPFRYEQGLATDTSLALRYRGEIVGWLLTNRESELGLHFSCLFVRADLQPLGRGFALFNEAISRHVAFLQGRPGYVAWRTSASLRPMCAFIRRRLAPYGTSVIEQFVSSKRLAPVGPPTATPRPRGQPLVGALLSATECSTAVDAITRARDAWLPRSESIDLFTLGAMAWFDAREGRHAYEAAAARFNPLLVTTLGWVYQRLFALLSRMLDVPVVHRDGWAVPVVRIVPSGRGAHLPVARVHADLEHRRLDSGRTSARRPISFSLLISDDDSGAGIDVWPLGYDQIVGLDLVEIAHLLDVVPPRRHPLAPGALFVHEADALHRTTPRWSDRPGPARITIEGHGIFSDDGCAVFG